MTPSSDLYQLVSSMNKAEKRHFKIYASQNSKNSNYVKLFDAINKMDNYNEAQLQKILSKESFSKKLAATKYLLYKLVLKSLSDLHSRRNIEGELTGMLNEVEILYRKTLYSQCRKLLHKARTIANAHEKSFYLYKILKWEKKLFFYSSNDQKTPSIETLLAEDARVTRLANNEASFMHLLGSIRLLYKNDSQTPEDFKAIEKIMNSSLLVDESHALTFKSKLCFYEIHSLNKRFCGEVKEAFDFLEKIVSLWEDNKEKIQSFNEDYLRHITDHIIYGMYVGKAFSLAKGMDRLVGVAPETLTNQEKVKLEMLKGVLRVAYYLHNRDMIKCRTAVKDLEALLPEHGNKLDASWQLSLHYQVSLYYFADARYNEALDWLDEVVYMTKSQSYTSIQNFCRILQLLAYYELDCIQLLESKLRSTYLFLKRREQIKEVDILFLKYVRKLVQAAGSRESQGILLNLSKALKDLSISGQTIPIKEKIILNHWLNSKLQGVAV